MTRHALATLLVAVALVGGAVADSVNFDSAPIGQAPADWTATQTGAGNAKWTIERDDTAPSKPNVLKQSGVATYPVCFKNDVTLKDGFVEGEVQADFGKKTRLAVWYGV